MTKSENRKTAKCEICGKAIYPSKSKICWDCHIKKVKKYYGKKEKLDGTKSKDRDYLSKREWSKKNKDKDIKSKKKWLENNKKKRKEVVKKWQKRNPEKMREKQKRSALRNPEKIKARNMARYIKKGEVCIFCGSKERLEKHHPNYSEPKLILTLCFKCHKKIHNGK